MTTKKANYQHLLLWIESNPKIRNINRFAALLNTSYNRVNYHFISGAFFKNDFINKAKETFNLTDSQVMKFFYTFE